MKTKQFVLLLFLNFILVSAFAQKDETVKKGKKTVTFDVDMDCHACVSKIESNIPYEKGVKDLKVSLDKKEVTVTFKTDKCTSAELVDAFKKLGYDAKVQPKKEEKKAIKKEN